VLALVGLLLVELAILHPGVFVRGEVLSSAALAYGMAPWRGHRPPTTRPLVGNPSLSDDLVLFTPWDAAVRAALARGRAPLWNPAAGCGMPLLANNQSAALAPTQVARLVYDSPRARTLGLIARPLLAGLGAFLLLLRLSRSPWGALLGGLAWANAAATTVWLLYPLGEVAAWLSWVALGLCETLGIGGEPRRRGPPLLTLALAAMLLAGHLPTAAQLLAALVPGTVAWLAVRRRLLPGLRRLALPVLAGVLLAMPQILPTAAYALSSHARDLRSGTTAAAREHLPSVAAWSWLVPRGQGSPEVEGYRGPLNFNEATAWVGVAPLLLAFLAVLAGRGLLPRALGVLVVACAALAYGAPVLPALVARVPVLAWCAGQRWVVLAQWSVALLAGLAVGSVEALRRRGVRLAGAALAGAVLVLVSLHPALRLPEGSPAAAFGAYQVLIAALEAALAGAIIALCPTLAPRAMAPALTGLVVARGVVFALGFNPTIPPAALPGITPDSRALAAAAGDGRALPFGWVLRPNTGMLAGIATVTGFDDLRPRRLAALAIALELDRLNATRSPSPATLRLAGRCAATVLAADRPLAGDRLAPVAGLQGPHLWAARLDGVHPLAGWYGAARPVRDQAAALQSIADGGVPDGVVLLEGLAAPTGEPAPAPVPLHLVRDRPEAITATAEQPRAGWVVVRELADPGWRALVDGRRAATATADGMFLAVPVEGGRHVVQLEYRPREWLLAGWLAALGAVAFLGCTVASLRRPAAPPDRSGRLVKSFK
jgi:hypothetical protein